MTSEAAPLPVSDVDRLSSSEELPEDAVLEAAQDPALRPKTFADFVGQPEAVKHLKVFIAAATKRGETLDHVLFYGPPGLGKTTLAQIVAAEMGYRFLQGSAPAIQKPGDIVAMLMSLEPNTVLFLDEIHRLPKTAAEHLYTAMEDRRMSIVIGEGPRAENVVFDVAPFTLVGATTRPGMLPAPLMDRFGISQRLEFYAVEDLAKILRRTADLMRIAADEGALEEISRRARGTPRIAKRLLKRARDFADDAGVALDHGFASEALRQLGIEEDGLDRQDRRYLEALHKLFRGGPTGVETLAAALHEDPDILEVSVEPHLMHLGFIQRTPRGRILTEGGARRISKLRGGALPVPGDGAPVQPAQHSLDLEPG